MTLTFSPDYIFVIGVGGTGGHISAPLSRLISYHPNTQESRVVFIDGDEFEEKNQTRQIVGDAQVGMNKARAMVDFCSYQGLTNVECRENFISTSTFIPLLRRSNSPLIVCSVDNDATRLDVINAIQAECEANGKDFFFITPGNSDGTETVKGQALWFGRLDGVDVGMNPKIAYPNIETPQDSIPHKGSCALNAPSRPQLIAANFMAAAVTLSVIQNLLDGVLSKEKSGMFFNIRTLAVSAS
jgi:hypothetical protein